MPRVKINFWLDLGKKEQGSLADYCASLRQKRLFSSTIRDALLLIRDLREKRLEALFRLFPWVNTWLEDRALAIAEAKLKDRDGGNSGNPGGQVADKLNRIEQLLISNTTGSATGGGLLSMAKQQVKALPEPEPELTVTKAAGGNAQNNLIISTFALNDMLDGLPDDMLRYGLDIGKITRKQLSKETLARLDHAAQHTVAMAPIPEAPPGGIRRLAGTDKPLPSPVFDDMEEDILPCVATR